MNTYFIRTVEADYPQLIALGVLLGAIAEVEGTIIATGGGCWDFIGTIFEQVGEIDGEPLMEPKCDLDGNEYIHVNIVTPINLADAAAELAAEHPEVADGLDNLGRYFLLDEEGNARAPTKPYRVFAS